MKKIRNWFRIKNEGLRMKKIRNGFRIKNEGLRMKKIRNGFRIRRRKGYNDKENTEWV